ncbi:MAG: (Fe-S)-binding protein [Thermoproteota archaeon]
MVHAFAEFRRKAPGYDCGLCGNATCSTFARKLLLGVSSISDCPILQQEGYAETRVEMENMMMKGVIHSSQSIITVPGLKTKYVHPNYFEDKAEKLPTRFFDYDTANYMISLLWNLEETRGSNVEVIDTDFGNMRFIVTTSGRIVANMGDKRVKDRELTNILYKVLWGSVDLLRKAEYAPRTVAPCLNTSQDAA